MFYEDLSPYRYHAVPTGLPGVFNVGWLRTSDHPVGDVEGALVAKLTTFSEAPVLRTRGRHRCELCGEVEGNGEIWIAGSDGRVYASPAMLPHYISRHRYAPPPVFLEVVRNAVAALPDAECDDRITAHWRKLQQAPSAEDILVPYYETKVYWSLDGFAELGEFDACLSSAFPMRFRSIARNARGYIVITECEDPAELLRELGETLRAAGQPCPFECSFKLVYVGGVEQILSAEP